MNAAGHKENASSEDLIDAEKIFLRRYSLKKVTVPKSKLKEIVNLTVVQNEDDHPDARLKSIPTPKVEKLKYQDLSKVIRSNMPWWLGTRGVLKNFSGQQLVSLVEVPVKEGDANDRCGCKNQRLQAGIETVNAVREDSKDNFNTAEVVCHDTAVPSTEPDNCVQKLTSTPTQFKTSSLLSNDEILFEIPKVKTVKVGSEHQNVADEMKSEAKTSKTATSAEMAWIEERLNRVHKLLLSLENLRLQSGCEKCQRKSKKNDRRANDDASSEPLCSSAHSSKTSIDVVEKYDNDGVRKASDTLLRKTPTTDVFIANVCKCDLDAIEGEIAELCAFITDLAERQNDTKEKSQYAVIMHRMREILQCFQKFTKKVIDCSECLRNGFPDAAAFPTQQGYFEEASRLSAIPNLYGPVDNGNFIKTSFLPCMSYNPSTGECIYPHDEHYLDERFVCSLKETKQSTRNVDNDDLHDCNCCIVLPSEEKKNCPGQLKEILAYIGTMKKDLVAETTTKDEKNAKKQKKYANEKENVEQTQTKSKNESGDRRLQRGGEDKMEYMDQIKRHAEKCNSEEKRKKSEDGAQILQQLKTTALSNERALSKPTKDNHVVNSPPVDDLQSLSQVKKDVNFSATTTDAAENQKRERPTSPRIKKKTFFSFSKKPNTAQVVDQDQAAPSCQNKGNEATTTTKAKKIKCSSPINDSDDTFKNPKSTVENSNKDIGNKISVVCREVCDESFKKISDCLKSAYQNQSDPDKQLCEIPIRTLCDLCKTACDNAIEKFKTLTNISDQTSARISAVQAPNEQITEMQNQEQKKEKEQENKKTSDIDKNNVKPTRVGKYDKSLHQSLPQMGANGGNERLANNSKPIFSFKSKYATPPASKAADSIKPNKDASGGDALQGAPNCACCYCEGLPPIIQDLEVAIKDRLKDHKRGTVFLKFTLSSTGCFHIQMATVDNEFLGCFHATESAVMTARRKNGFDGCITLSVIEPSCNSSEINRLVDHAFMVVQQERKS